MTTMLPYSISQPLPKSHHHCPRRKKYQCWQASETDGTKGAKLGVSSKPYRNYLVGDGLAKSKLEIETNSTRSTQALKLAECSLCGC